MMDLQVQLELEEAMALRVLKDQEYVLNLALDLFQSKLLTVSE